MTRNFRDYVKRVFEINEGIPERIAKNMSDDELKAFRDDLKELNAKISTVLMFILFVEISIIGVGMMFAEFVLGMTVDELNDQLMFCLVLLYFTVGIMIPYGLMSSRTAKYTKLMEKRYYKE